MRKSLIIGCLLFILSITGLVFIGIAVAAQDEEVYLTETVLEGEKGYGSDISFRINSHWDEKMLWETSVDIGEETVTDTDFSFYPDGFDYEVPSESSAQFEYSMNFGYGSSGDLFSGGHRDIPYYDVFKDVASRTEPGEERTETVKLADYYEYFDLELHYNSKKYLGRYTYGSYNEDEHAYINRVLAMRIPEELEFEATVTKHENGHVYDINGNAGETVVRIISDGIVLKDGIYVYVYVVNDEGLLPGVSETGYGIYKVPLAWGALQREKDTAAIIMLEEFALVYPLEEKILAMKADEAEEELFVVLERGGAIYLQRIHKESMTLLQEFSLGITEEWIACHDMQVTENGVLLLMNNRKIYFAEKQGEQYQITVNYSMPQEVAFAAGSWDRYAFDYKDGRLAVIWGDSSAYYYGSSSSVYVFVIEKEELMFLAHYKSSLDHVNTFWDYDNKLHPGQAYEISFEE